MLVKREVNEENSCHVSLFFFCCWPENDLHNSLFIKKKSLTQHPLAVKVQLKSVKLYSSIEIFLWIKFELKHE